MAEGQHKTTRREAIAAGAFAALDDVGLDRLTIRRVAERVGVRPSALYWHFANKGELLDYLADALLDEELEQLTTPDAAVEWSTWLDKLAHRLRRALLSRRDGPRLLAGASPTQAGLPRVIETTLTILRSAGLSLHSAAFGANTIVNFTIGFALEQQTVHLRETVADDDNTRPERFRPDAARYPNLAEAAAISDADAEFQHGIDLIVAGIRATNELPQAGSETRSGGSHAGAAHRLDEGA